MPAHNPQSVAALEKMGAFVKSDVNDEVVFVNLYGIQVTDSDLESLKGLASLKNLILRGCSLFTGAGLEHLGRLTKLEFLNLWGTPITDTGLEHLQVLSNLKTLLLGDTSVTDAGLENLEGLTNLQTMDLSVTRVTGEGVRQFRQMLPNCQIRC